MIITTNIIQNIICLVNKNIGSPLLLPAHGKGGARATINNNSPLPFEKIFGEAQAGGQKEKGVWGK